MYLIIPTKTGSPVCLKLCWHNLPGPTVNMNSPMNFYTEASHFLLQVINTNFIYCSSAPVVSSDSSINSASL